MSGVNGDVYVVVAAQGIGFAGETIVVQGDTVGMARIHFTSSQHRLHLADKCGNTSSNFKDSALLNSPVMLARSTR